MRDHNDQALIADHDHGVRWVQHPAECTSKHSEERAEHTRSLVLKRQMRSRARSLVLKRSRARCLALKRQRRGRAWKGDWYIRACQAVKLPRKQRVLYQQRKCMEHIASGHNAWSAVQGVQRTNHSV
jgi:hypothetical protein